MQVPLPTKSLRDLGLPSRFALAGFLLTVGLGYFCGLVQMHFQLASPGQLMPTVEDTVAIFYGRRGTSQMERLLVNDEGKPFNGSGTMRTAFTSKSSGWAKAIKRRAKDKNLSLQDAETEIRQERDGERLALLEWIKGGTKKQPYEDNGYVVSASLTEQPITEAYVDRSSDGKCRVKIASIWEVRCARCHAEGVGGAGSQIPLENHEQIQEFCGVESAAGGMSLKKLAQSTHVHLLTFAMLYGLTGFIVTFTSYPAWFRCILGVWPLLAMVVDISCWWLGRFDPWLAALVYYSGGAVACGLFLQIALCLWEMFGEWIGKKGLIALIIIGALGGGSVACVVKTQFLDPYLATEGRNAPAE